MTHPNTWKAAERKNAAIFGAKRNVLSGSSGRDDRSESDSTHDTLFIESKLRARCTARSLWQATKAKADKAGQTPLVILREKGKHGALLIFHEDDLPAICQAYLDVNNKSLNDHA
jgi:hypothetical protein